MANKKEVNILLLGIVAILAIVGLVLLFTSPAATGRAYQYPPIPPTVEYPAGVGAEEVAPFGTALQVTPGRPCATLPTCPSGLVQTFQQHNIKQVGGKMYRIGVCECPVQSNYPKTWVYMELV